MPEEESCEFALIIADAMQGKGLGQKLMTALMDTARAKGLKVIAGEVLKTNTNMLKLMNRLGFSVEDRLDDDNIKRCQKNIMMGV